MAQSLPSRISIPSGVPNGYHYLSAQDLEIANTGLATPQAVMLEQLAHNRQLRLHDAEALLAYLINTTPMQVEKRQAVQAFLNESWQ